MTIVRKAVDLALNGKKSSNPELANNMYIYFLFIYLFIHRGVGSYPCLVHDRDSKDILIQVMKPIVKNSSSPHQEKDRDQG